MSLNYKVLAISKFRLIKEIGPGQRLPFLVLIKRSATSRGNNGQAVICEKSVAKKKLQKEYHKNDFR